MERIVRLPDNQVIKNQRKIDKLLTERRSIMDKRKTTSPPDVIGNLDLKNAVLSKETRNHIAAIELDYGGVEPFVNRLYEIPDIRVDLTPQAGDLPRNIVNYKLTAGNSEITLEVLFNAEQKDYWKYYGNQNKLDETVSSNLLEALQKKNWHCDWVGAWSVKE